MADAIGYAEFRARLEELGPFETRAHLAVAYSGGRDSTALLWLAKNWAEQTGGQLTALIVDHRLRAEAAQEAHLAAAMAQSLGVSAKILRWHHGKLSSGLQAKARDARYELLNQACERGGILHLLVGHHLDDQIETVVMRQERQSGVIGLAGMSAIRELTACRLLRPLLIWPRARIEATLQHAKRNWLDDPSNASKRFWRGRFRTHHTAGPENICSNIERRRIFECKLATCLAHSITVSPKGYVSVARSLCQSLNEALLGRLIATIGGNRYAHDTEWPKTDSSKAGTVVAPRSNWVAVLREASRIEGVVDIEPGSIGHWDRRFVIDNRKGSETASFGHVKSSDARELRAEVSIRPALVAATLPNLHQLPPGCRAYFGAEQSLTNAPFTR